MQLFSHFFDFLILNMFTNHLWTGVWTNFTDVPCPIPWGGVVTHCFHSKVVSKEGGDKHIRVDNCVNHTVCLLAFLTALISAFISSRVSSGLFFASSLISLIV